MIHVSSRTGMTDFALVDLMTSKSWVTTIWFLLGSGPNKSTDASSQHFLGTLLGSVGCFGVF